MFSWLRGRSAGRNCLKPKPVELSAEDKLKQEARETLWRSGICPKHGLPLAIPTAQQRQMGIVRGPCPECKRIQDATWAIALAEREAKKQAALELLGLDDQYLAHQIREALCPTK